GQFGARNDVLVPGGEVLRLRGEYGLLHGVTVAAVATGYPGFRTVSNDSPDCGHPGRSAAGGPASTTAPPVHHSVGTGWYDRRRHPDHGYEIDRVDGSGCSAAPTEHSTRARRRATHREGGERWRCTPAPACTSTTRRSARKGGATASTWATSSACSCSRSGTPRRREPSSAEPETNRRPVSPPPRAGGRGARRGRRAAR